MNDPAAPDSPRSSGWPRAALLLAPLAALAWCVLIRVPLIVNAETHLDSDLAVDGLTLREAIQGHWRWHYPGTPHMGTGAVLLSWVPAQIAGATPSALVVGGAIAYLLLVLGVFATAWRSFGPRAAGWCLVPLAFASTGTIWLTGRITGGHMLAAAWSAGAWWLLALTLEKGGRARALLLGLWCGLGLYHDSLFLMTLIGLVPAGLLAAVASRWGNLWGAQAVLPGLALMVGFAIGLAPSALGRWVDPYDAYHEQFAWSLDQELVREHSRILFLDCLPRLIAGHRLPGLEADPDPALLGSAAPIRRAGERAADAGWIAGGLTLLSLGLFAVSLAVLAARSWNAKSAAARATALGLSITTAATLAAFVVNRNIFNADNYRYLVLLLIPWALGFGLLAESLARRSTGGLTAAVGLALAVGVLFTLDQAAWYRRLGWVDDRLAVVRRPLDDPAIRWLDERPEVDSFAAGYWDAYRLAFLSRRPLRGVPHPIHPNRFPEWSSDLPGGRPEILIARPTPEDQFFLRKALDEGGRVLHRERGTTIATWPAADAPQ